MEKIIIVGAGFSGATIARLFADSGKEVIVIDKKREPSLPLHYQFP